MNQSECLRGKTFKENPMLAYDYPILGLFWSMMIFFFWVAWIMLLFYVIMDIFRSDMRGLSKALWAIFVIIAPWLGALIYLIANGDDMSQRSVDAMEKNEAETQAYIRNAASSGSTAEEIDKLHTLHTNGVLTDAEFAQQKAKLLA
jgi:hypothetical protein